MPYLVQMNDKQSIAFSSNKSWFLAWGIALIILGIFAISYASTATLISIVFLGIVLAISGAVVIIDAFHFWRQIWSGFFFHLILGLLYLAVGIMLIKGPISGAISLTLLLAILYIVLGIFRIIYSLSVQLPRQGWRLFNGVITLILGILIYKSWPMSGLFIIGLFIGIDLIIAGWVYVMAALSIKTANK